jgi:GAF domain-containing protein
MTLIAVGSQRPDFPSQTERLLFSVAANQVAIGLQKARLLTEQKSLIKESRNELANLPRRMRNSGMKSPNASARKRP